MKPMPYPIALRRFYFRKVGAEYFVPPHTHVCPQWYCVVSGEAEQIIDGQRMRLRAEESVLIPPGASRSPRCAGKALGYIVATFENKRLDLAPLHRRRLACPAELLPDLHALALELQRPGAPHGEDLSLLLFLKLLIGLRRAVAEKCRPAGGLNAAANQAIVERVEAHMRSRLQCPLSREDFAGAANLSGSHLARLFRQATGKTLIERLTELRLWQARVLLRESTLPITHVALEVGYASFSHFARIFRRKMGLTPSAFRRAGGSAAVFREPE